MISKLKKLKGRSLAELTDRGRQKLNELSERSGLSKGLRAPTDRELLRSLNCKASTAAELLDHFQARPTNLFYPSFDDRGETVKSLLLHFPDEHARLVTEAERICRGKFDLLGLSDLDFGGAMPDWHLEPISGKRSPIVHRSGIEEIDARESGDKKIVWELNRHQYLTILGSAYWLTADEKYAQTAMGHIKDWILNNPPKNGVNWISSLEIAYRSISWIWAVNFFLRSPNLTADTLTAILKCLAMNASHIERNLSTYTSPNTHLTGEALALFVLGTFLPEFRSAGRWLNKGREILENEINVQIRDDGGYVEQSTHYQRYTTDIYLSFFILVNSRGDEIDLTLRDKLASSLEFLMYATQPNGRTPLIGDDDGGRLHFLDGRPVDDFRSTLAVGAGILGDPNLKFAAGGPSPELLWLLGPKGLAVFDSLVSEQPLSNVKPFSESGFYSIRSGWERSSAFMVIDCGPHGFLYGGHAHADALAFVMSLDGIPVFVDSGTFSYTADVEARDRFRSTAAHNCLTVNGESSSIPAGPFSWRRTATSNLLEWKADGSSVVFRGTHDGFEALGVGYEREIRFSDGGETQIIDKIKTSASRSFEINFVLSPDVIVVSLDEMSVVIRTKEGNRDLLRIDTKLADATECTGWKFEATSISPRYGSLAATTKLVLRVLSDRDCEITNSIIALSPDR